MDILTGIDVSRFPRELLFGPPDNQVDLGSVVMGLRSTFDSWAREGLVKKHSSFGFAVADPSSRFMDYNNPYDFVWFVVGWGEEGDRYIANAVRKLRSALRFHRDTLDLRLSMPEGFQDTVPSVDENGEFPWGDFPWGGATFVRVGGITLPCSVSTLKEVEDDAAAKTIGGHIGATMLRVDHPSEFG